MKGARQLLLGIPFMFIGACQATACPGYSGTYKVHKNANLYIIKDAGVTPVLIYKTLNKQEEIPLVRGKNISKDYAECALVLPGGSYFVQLTEEEKANFSTPDVNSGNIVRQDISSRFLIIKQMGFGVNYIELDKID